MKNVAMLLVSRSCNALRISNYRCFVSPAGPSARRRSDFLPRFSALVNVPAEETPPVYQSPAVERKIEQLQGARDAIKELIGRTHSNPILIRLGWHDAGTYDENIREWPKCGGANGSLRFSAELDHEANAGLLNAFKLLLPIKVKFNSISYADLFQLASATAVEMAGGPRIPMKYGRVDTPFPDEFVKQGNLPSAAASNPGDHLRKVFHRMGFNDMQIVALSGAHTLGRARPERSGWGKPETKYTKDGPGVPGGQSWTVQWLKFDNSYFKHIKERKDEDLLVLPTDAVLFEDPGFKNYAEVYAQDQDAFFRDYAQAHARLSELGAKFEPAEGIFIDEPAGARSLLVSARSLHNALSQISRRIFAGSAKRATEVDVHRTCAVVRQVEQLEGARYEIKKVIGRTHCSSILIRLGWYDARTYDINITEWPNCGGANGSLRFSGHDAGAGLQNVLKLLEPIKEKFNSISYADLFQLVSATAIEMAGGPRIPMKYGRVDTAGLEEWQECNLSCESGDPADQLRKIFYRMGLNDKEIVALLGAPTLGTGPERSRWGKSETNCTQEGPEALGGQSLVVRQQIFDNSYFKDIKERKDKDLPVLPIDAVLFEDPRFKVYAELYAQDIAAFFKDYAQAHAKLSELGTKFKPYKGISIDATADAVTACLEALVYWSLSPGRGKGRRNSPMQRDPLSGFWNGPIGQRISAAISCNLEQHLSRDAYFSSGLTEDSVIRWIQDSEIPRLRGEIKEQKACCCKSCLGLYTRLLVLKRIREPFNRCLFGKRHWCEEEESMELRR